MGWWSVDDDHTGRGPVIGRGSDESWCAQSDPNGDCVVRSMLQRIESSEMEWIGSQRSSEEDEAARIEPEDDGVWWMWRSTRDW